MNKIINDIVWYIPFKKLRNALRNYLTKLAEPQQIEHEALLYLFKNKNMELTVQYSNFQGMKYIDTTNFGAIYHKLLGSYEEPIENWIYEIKNKNYDVIIDIGCSEGYYAVGFAYKGFANKIIAYDIDTSAINMAKRLQSINELKSELIFINSECTFNDIENIIKASKKVLIFCDIEGGEVYLLDNEKCKALNKADIILESHDLFFNENRYVTETIKKRFQNTHKIEMIQDYKRDESKYPIIKDLTIEQKYKILYKNRGVDNMIWMRLTSDEHL
ncbi:class I SAM-dependent methyltransferase [Brachyspira hyodysenteriae]|uniref:50S ribosomal protein L11 methyltransferase n=1 Tax=Brachyspira hyodysenteriae TaxID=159 RepID=UPI0022CDBABD|nr:class I SAM-dependent methyltransferase [Brachyspira hyodysenteriae]MDA0048193.1 class I SAM-dependent methyltransferase [Brachyspira hyodysenteriae]